jgi:hypothetical protein
MVPGTDHLAFGATEVTEVPSMDEKKPREFVFVWQANDANAYIEGQGTFINKSVVLLGFNRKCWRTLGLLISREQEETNWAIQ